MADDRLEIIIESQAEQANSELDKLISKFDELESSLDKLTNTLEQSPMDSSIKETRNIIDRSTSSMTRSISSLIAKVYALSKSFSGLAKGVKSAMDYQETVHLFSTVFTRIGRRAGDDFYKGFFDRLNEFQGKFIRLGINPDDLMNYQAMFGQMADAMGVLPKTAYEISESFTALGADLSALFNLPIEESMRKLQSGLSGQIRPLRELGIDISKTTLMEEARMRGIEKSVEVMTASEKVQLRYLAIMRQTVVAHGDMAKTVLSPANSLRVLTMQIRMAGRAIGSILLPMVQRVLPYLTAIAIVIQRIASAIAGFFGYQLPKLKEEITFDYSTPDIRPEGNMLNDWGKEKKNIGKTEKAVKKLRKSVLGFDELNLLQDPKDPSLKAGGSGGKGGAGSGGGGLGAGFDLSDEISDMNKKYQKLLDDILKNTANKANEIADRIQKPFERILKLVGLIGLAIWSWKVANKLYDLFTGNTTNKGLLASIMRIGKAIVKPSGELIKMQSVLGNSTAYVATEAILAAMAATIMVMVLRTIDLVKNSKLFRDGLKAIFKGIVTAFDWIFRGLDNLGEKISSAIKPLHELPVIGKFAKALDLDFADLGLTILGVGLLFTPFGVFGKAILIFEAVTVAIRAIGFVTNDAVKDFELFGDEISDTTKEKLEPFMDNMKELDTTIRSIDYGGLKITGDIVEDVSQKVKQISQTIINELDADMNESLKTLEPLKHAMGEESYNKLIESNRNYYENMKARVLEGEEQINEIYRRAHAENRELTEEEQAEIYRIRDEFMETGIQHLTENEIEYNAIMNKLKDNATRISLEQSSEIIKNAKKTRDSTVKDAEMQYSKIELEAKRMLDSGAINKTQYKEMMKAAKDARDSTIKDAEEQYETIYNTTTEKLGANAKYINEETGEIKSNWEMFTSFLSSTWSRGMETVKNVGRSITSSVTNTFNSFMNRVKTTWRNIGNAMSGAVEGARDKIRRAVDAISGFFSRLKIKPIKIPRIKLPHFRMTGEFSLIPPRVPRISVDWYDKGGVFYGPQIIGVGEKRPEFVGALDDLRQIVREESGGGTNDNISLVIQLGNATVYREIIKGIKDYERQSGQRLL